MKSLDKDPAKLRLQVFLSRNGVCSRRRALDIITQGHVKLNGRICREPSTPVDGRKDFIEVDGIKVETKSYDYVMLNKLAGYTTTKLDKYAEKTVFELLPKKYNHLAPVGRLDKETEGLLIFTNDGDVAQRLTHPKQGVDKTYVVRISGLLDKEKVKQLERGVIVDGKKTYPSKIFNVHGGKDQTELSITIHEGRKRQIRLMFAKVGHEVIDLKRITQGPLELGLLKKGMWRLLTEKEIDKIKKL